MKKLLGLFGAVGLVTSSSTTTMAMSNNNIKSSAEIAVSSDIITMKNEFDFKIWTIHTNDIYAQEMYSTLSDFLTYIDASHRSLDNWYQLKFEFTDPSGKAIFDTEEDGKAHLNSKHFKESINEMLQNNYYGMVFDDKFETYNLTSTSTKGSISESGINFSYFTNKERTEKKICSINFYYSQIKAINGDYELKFIAEK